MQLSALRNSQGASLLAVMMSASIMMIVLLTVQSTIQHLFKSYQGVKISDEAHDFQDSFVRLLNDPAFCTIFFTGVPYNPNLKGTSAIIAPVSGSASPEFSSITGQLQGGASGTLIGKNLQVEFFWLEWEQDLLSGSNNWYTDASTGARSVPFIANVKLVLKNLSIPKRQALGPPKFGIDIPRQTFIARLAGSSWVIDRCLAPSTSSDYAFFNKGWTDSGDTTQCTPVQASGTDGGITCPPGHAVMQVTAGTVSGTDINKLRLTNYRCCKVPVE